MNPHKKLYRSKTNRMISGICGGIGEYFQIDAVLVRVIWVLIVLGSGIFPGVIAYIIFAYIIPRSLSLLRRHQDRLLRNQRRILQKESRQ